MWARDAFDRIIVAQARLNGPAPPISSDEEIAEHYPRAIWQFPTPMKKLCS
jgi:PIN domain nuclease of toxin-antitoxin system